MDHSMKNILSLFDSASDGKINESTPASVRAVASEKQDMMKVLNMFDQISESKKDDDDEDEPKSKIHKGKYGTEYQGDDDESETKTDKKKSDTKAKRGRPEKDSGPKHDTSGIASFLGTLPKGQVGTVSKKNSLKEYMESVESSVEQQLNEKWGTETKVSPAEKGKYAGKTKAELLKAYHALKKSGPHKKGSEALGKLRELAFAIRAKGDWGKVDEVMQQLDIKQQPGMFTITDPQTRTNITTSDPATVQAAKSGKLQIGKVMEDDLDERSVSQAQARMMAGAAHDPKFAKKVGVSQRVAKEFNKADTGKKISKLPQHVNESAMMEVSPTPDGVSPSTKQFLSELGDQDHFDNQQPTVTHHGLKKVLDRFPHEHKSCQQGWGMDSALYEALCEHYFEEGRIPRAVWHGPSEGLREFVEECYGQDTGIVMDESVTDRVPAGPDPLTIPAVNRPGTTSYTPVPPAQGTPLPGASTTGTPVKPLGEDEKSLEDELSDLARNTLGDDDDHLEENTPMSSSFGINPEAKPVPSMNETTESTLMKDTTFESWNSQLENLINEDAVSEGITISTTTGNQGQPDSINVSASEDDAKEVMALLRNAGMSILGATEVTDGQAGELVHSPEGHVEFGADPEAISPDQGPDVVDPLEVIRGLLGNVPAEHRSDYEQESGDSEVFNVVAEDEAEISAAAAAAGAAEDQLASAQEQEALAKSRTQDQVMAVGAADQEADDAREAAGVSECYDDAQRDDQDEKIGKEVTHDIENRQDAFAALLKHIKQLDEESSAEEDNKAEHAGEKVAKDIEWDEEHKDHDDGSKERHDQDDKAELAGEKVKKEIEYDDKKDRVEEGEQICDGCSHTMSECSCGPMSESRLRNIFSRLLEISEGKDKKADKDYDGDGKIETSAEEHAGAVDNAIKKSKGKKLDEYANSNDDVKLQDTEFVTNTISGGLNGQKRDQTTLPYTSVKEASDEDETLASLKKLSGI